jgi:phage shock protein PspC (stress-responsive transcriptional regulator)
MNETKTCSGCFEHIDARAGRCPKCTQRQPDVPGFHRDVPGRLVSGVCAALAAHFNWDVTVMRVAVVALGFFSASLVFWVYLALWVMTPAVAGGEAPAQRALSWLSRLFAPPQPLSRR